MSTDYRKPTTRSNSAQAQGREFPRFVAAAVNATGKDREVYQAAH
jgi:hypothetical protein